MFNSDLPIKKTNEDALNRSSFVENLAKAMLDYTVPEGFTIGMYGKWGSGKTSIINMILEQVEILSTDLPQKPIILKFNPWLCSDPKQLISQFFKQLSSAIKIKQPKLDEVCKFMNDYSDAFDIAGTIPMAGTILSTVGRIINKKAKIYTETKSNDLQNIKEKIISTLSKEKIKIIITIDDIDRLYNTEIVSVFQLVKSLADFPYTIYLLAFDREVVIRALSEVQKGNGSEYLEKVIQVPFELPSPNVEDIYQVFFAKLSSVISCVSEEQWDKDYWSEMFHFGIKTYLKSIRDVVRFVNTFALKYTLLKDEINIIDLLGLTCIQVFEAEIYSRLPSQKGQLCGGSNGYYNQHQHEKDEVRNSCDLIFEGISEKRIKNAKNILTKLFPKLNSIENNLLGFSRYYNHYETLNNCSISNTDCFERYFALTLESNAISQQVINYLLFNATYNELIEGIIKMNSSKKLIRLLDHIQAVFMAKNYDQKYSERAKIILKCLIYHWHKLDDNEDTSFFSLSFDRLLPCTVEVLLKVICETERYDLVCSLFDDINVNISSIVTLLYYFESKHNRFTEEKTFEQIPILTLNDVIELEKIFIKRTIVEFESGNLLDNNSAMSIIWLFGHLDAVKAKEYVNKIIDSDLSLVKFINTSVTHGKGAGRTVYKLWNAHKDYIKPCVCFCAYKKVRRASERITRKNQIILIQIVELFFNLCQKKIMTGLQIGRAHV